MQEKREDIYKQLKQLAEQAIENNDLLLGAAILTICGCMRNQGSLLRLSRQLQSFSLTEVEYLQIPTQN